MKSVTERPAIHSFSISGVRSSQAFAFGNRDVPGAPNSKFLGVSRERSAMCVPRVGEPSGRQSRELQVGIHLGRAGAGLGPGGLGPAASFPGRGRAVPKPQVPTHCGPDALRSQAAAQCADRENARTPSRPSPHRAGPGNSPQGAAPWPSPRSPKAGERRRRRWAEAPQPRSAGEASREQRPRRSGPPPSARPARAGDGSEERARPTGARLADGRAQGTAPRTAPS